VPGRARTNKTNPASWPAPGPPDLRSDAWPLASAHRSGRKARMVSMGMPLSLAIEMNECRSWLTGDPTTQLDRRIRAADRSRSLHRDLEEDLLSEDIPVRKKGLWTCSARARRAPAGCSGSASRNSTSTVVDHGTRTTSGCPSNSVEAGLGQRAAHRLIN
jgi:hypothetical protein